MTAAGLVADAPRYYVVDRLIGRDLDAYALRTAVACEAGETAAV